MALVEVHRIGSVEGPDALSSVADVVVVSDGEAYILERHPPQVLRYDARGTRVGAFGDEGEGPGEFPRPSTLGVVGDRVWVADFGARELEIFTAAGEPETTLRIEIAADPGGAAAIPRALLSSGNVIAGPAGTSIGAAISGALEHETFYLATTDGEVLDTLYRLTVPGTDFMRGELGEGRLFMGSHPMPERAAGGLLPRRVRVAVERWEAAVAHSASYRVRVWNAAGEPETDRAVRGAIPAGGAGWLGLFVARTSVSWSWSA